MRLKRNSLIVLLLGFVSLLVGTIMPVIYWKNLTEHYGATVGIIGGADAPTYQLLLSSIFEGIPSALIVLGITLIFSSGFCLLFSKTVSTYCNIATSAISLGLSAVGALGLVCALSCFAIIAFWEPSRYPIQFPASIILGMLCLFAFFALIVLYFKVRCKNWSIKGLAIDVITSILYLPALFFMFACLYEMIT